MNAKTVGAVATLTGVSVRTLHHYDDIGLVVPSVRTPAGYRGYTDADLERLQLVLTYRAAGLPLDEIRALLDDADADVVANLQRQHALLTEQANRLQDTIKAAEAAEAQARWGDTDAWKQSQQRTARLTEDDWARVRADGTALLDALAESKRAGVAPGSPRADELAARHRASIEQFYDCNDDMQRCLVQMYLADERFTRYYDDVEPGLAQYVHDIVVASIDR
ncbi:MAG: MerR family transcriptional regulator, thiopeptide resistance regulator [Mycobacterium sp.]|jgi:DNA-binding transcriptional MerR regulator|nr:MerR family transcriptional regulator, thiopeptide resistance regulator [Mycobacterium sp.]